MQLVGPLGKHAPPPPGSNELANLTPEIVLEVLRIVNREIQLREETRELDQAREAMEEKAVRERGVELSETQGELSKKSLELVEQIKLLPDAPKLGKDIEKLTGAALVMDEVQGLLATPATGPPTIAAISEVIEILLETHRVPNAPMIVKAPSATASALMLMGLGDDGGNASIENRAPEQATGKSGRKLPEEFRQGLDAYLNALEGNTIQ